MNFLIIIYSFLMEDSNIKAKYVYYCKDSKFYECEDNITNVSQLSDHIKNYNFGDLVSFSEYRDTGTYIIGKDGKLVDNLDYSNSGYLTIPYEITQYLDDAVNKYKEVDPMYIDLRYDDKFIIENINTTSCKIKKEWDWKLTLYSGYLLFVKFPNGNEHDFDVSKTSAYKIKKWYEASEKEQSKLKVFFQVKGNKYDKFKKYTEKNRHPKIPSTWSSFYSGGGGGYRNSYSNFTYQGPIDEEEKVIKSIEKYYNGYDYSITKVTN